MYFGSFIVKYFIKRQFFDKVLVAKQIDTYTSIICITKININDGKLNGLDKSVQH